MNVSVCLCGGVGVGVCGYRGEGVQVWRGFSRLCAGLRPLRFRASQGFMQV